MFITKKIFVSEYGNRQAKDGADAFLGAIALPTYRLWRSNSGFYEKLKSERQNLRLIDF